MNIPQVPKDITNAKQMQDYMTGIQKALTQKQIDDDKTISDITNKLVIATQAEAQTGLDNTKIITPLSLRQGLNANGSAPVYACRAWVNFNGTGTVAIRGSGNVSSVTDNGIGLYTVNFTVSIEDNNYDVNLTEKLTRSYNAWIDSIGILSMSTSSISIQNQSVNTGYYDNEIICVSIFR